MTEPPNPKYVSPDKAREIFRAWVGMMFTDRFLPPTGRLVLMDVRPAKAPK